MNILRLFRSKPSSAPVARERLQILLEYERHQHGKPDLAAILRDEILEVVSRHVSVDKVQVKLERHDGVATLAVDIEIPHAATG
jgi:cell division topological specificity factor